MLYYSPLHQGWQKLDLVWGAECYLTHNTKTRADILSAGTCSVLSLQKWRVFLRRWAYRKKNRKHCHIINEPCVTNGSPYVPHDFFPCQAYLIFRRKVNKFSKGELWWCGLPRLPGSEESHRRRWWWLQLYNTGGNRSFSVAKSAKIDAHLHCGTGDLEVQRSGKSACERDKRKELT